MNDDDQNLSLTEMADIDEDQFREEAEFEFATIAEWPDEDKPKVEKKYRRKRPIPDSSWVLLGNDELWLIPCIEQLGRDILPVRSLGKIKYIFDHIHWGSLRKIYAKVINNVAVENDDLLKFNVEPGEVFHLMMQALRANYRIPENEVAKLGLLREEHFGDIMKALTGNVKKKESTVESSMPLPFSPKAMPKEP